MDAARRFDPSYGTKLLTYATPIMESAIADYAARSSLPLSIPPSRYHQLRRVAYVCAGAQDESESALTDAVCKELGVSPKVAATLLEEYRALFNTRRLDDRADSISCGGDPARAYDLYMRRALLLRQMEEVLKPGS